MELIKKHHNNLLIRYFEIEEIQKLMTSKYY